MKDTTILFDDDLRRKSKIEPDKLLPLIDRIKKRSLRDYAKLVGIVCIYADEHYMNIR